MHFLLYFPFLFFRICLSLTFFHHSKGRALVPPAPMTTPQPPAPNKLLQVRVSGQFDMMGGATGALTNVFLLPLLIQECVIHLNTSSHILI